MRYAPVFMRLMKTSNVAEFDLTDIRRNVWEVSAKYRHEKQLIHDC